MNKLKTAIRNAEVDGLSDSIIRNFKADEKAQSDSFLKSALEELESLSAQITTAILQDKTLSTLDSADSARDEAIKTLGTVLAAYAVFPIASKKELSAPLKAIYDKYKITQNGVAYYMMSCDDMNELGVIREKIKAYVNLFSGYDEIKIWVQFSEDAEAVDDFKWRVSIRSRGIKINDVASKYNGGGHDNASGAKCRDVEEMEHLIQDLDDLLK